MHLVIHVINKTQVVNVIKYNVYTFDELDNTNHDKTIQYYNDYETNTEVFVLDTKNPAYKDIINHIIHRAYSNIELHKLKLIDLSYELNNSTYESITL